MTDSMISMLARIEEEEQIIHRSIYNQISEDAIHYFKEWLKTRVCVELDYLDAMVAFAKLADGLNFNGLFIYSLDPTANHNIYDSNADWWEVEAQRQYLFFADDDISWYCVQLEDKEFWVLDKPSGERMESFDSLDALLTAALETSLA
jgi:hypothetical protein